MDKTKKKKGFKVPHTFVILFFLTLIAAILTWVVPPGQFEYEAVDVDGTIRNLVIPGSFDYIERDPSMRAGVIDFFSSFHKGLIAASEVVMLIFLVNGAFSLVIKSGAVNALLGNVLRKFKGKEKIIIPMFFIVFALGSSFFGMLNEYNGLYPIFVGLGVALGYDALVGFSILALGAYMGFTGSIMNPYTVVVGQSIAGIPLYSNTPFRVLSFIVFCTIAILWIFRYMKKIKEDPSKSLMVGYENQYVSNGDNLEEYTMTGKHKIILFSVIAALGLIIWGSVNHGWGAIELTGVFVMMGLLAGIIQGWDADKIAEEFIDGSRSVVYGALVTGVARATLVILQDGMIIDTIINFLSSGLVNVPPILSAQGMLVIQTLINFIIPSGSGQAATVIPILAPIGDIVGVSREVVVLAFQYGDGLSNLLWPTCGITVISGLADIPIERWWKFYIPLFGILFLAQMGLLTLAVVLGI